jgi:thymidylate synthase
MTPERRLDRLESIVKLMIKAGRRERKESREKINALIDAQMRTEEALAQFARGTEALAQFAHGTEESMAQLSRKTDKEMARLARAQANTEERLSAFIRNTDEKLGTLINTVNRIANERGNGKA